jgi:Uncharacterized conserved protein (DUF2278)
MLPAYGVAVGKYLSYTREQGRWLHVTFKLKAGKKTYEAAVDVNEPQGPFQYQALADLDADILGALASLKDGWHALKPNSTSGAIDYARSPVLTATLGAWLDVTGDEAGNALVPMLTGSTRVFAFGAPYTTGLGVHDVHCNQGDPPGEFQSLDGIWQDGCVIAIQTDGTISAYLGKFASQTLDTDDNGLPV